MFKTLKHPLCVNIYRDYTNCCDFMVILYLSMDDIRIVYDIKYV